MISPELVQRLGFDSYASNIIANLFENGCVYDGYQSETEDTAIKITTADNRFVVMVRCYVPSIGWRTAEILL
jgi:hypothetical protein